MPSLEDRGPSQVIRPLTSRGNGRFRQDGKGGAKHGASERRLLMPLRGAIFFALVIIVDGGDGGLHLGLNHCYDAGHCRFHAAGT